MAKPVNIQIMPHCIDVHTNVIPNHSTNIYLVCEIEQVEGCEV